MELLTAKLRTSLPKRILRRFGTMAEMHQAMLLATASGKHKHRRNAPFTRWDMPSSKL